MEEVMIGAKIYKGDSKCVGGHPLKYDESYLKPEYPSLVLQYV